MSGHGRIRLREYPGVGRAGFNGEQIRKGETMITSRMTDSDCAFTENLVLGGPDDRTHGVVGVYPATDDKAPPVAEVTIFRGTDGALVVQVDTLVDTGHVRINLNDNTVYDGDPEVDE